MTDRRCWHYITCTSKGRVSWLHGATRTGLARCCHTGGAKASVPGISEQPAVIYWRLDVAWAQGPGRSDGKREDPAGVGSYLRVSGQDRSDGSVGRVVGPEGAD